MRRRLTRVLAFLLLFVPVTLAGCGPREAAQSVITHVVEEKKAPPEGYVPVNNGFRYAKNQLTPDEQYLYDQLVAGIDAMSPEIPDLYPDKDRIFAVASAIHRDYPEFFWFNGAGEVETSLMGGVPVSAVYRPKYTMDSTARASCQQQIDQWTADCLSGLYADATDYDKVLTIFRYIIDHTDYQKVDSNSIVNVMVNGSGLCGCYAMTTQYLLNRVGVDCTYVRGMAHGEDHAWNLVWLDGNPCWLDTTWGDPVFEGGNPGDGPCYDYFCITTADLLRTHIVEDTIPIPDCVCEDYNYYRRSGQYFDAYDRSALVYPVEQAILRGEKQISLRFSDGAYPAAKEGLFTNAEIFDLFKAVDDDLGTTFSQTKQYTYTGSESMGSITLIIPTEKGKF